MNRFLSMIRFLTRIPVKTDTGFDEEFHKGMYYFPVVGSIIGIIVYAVMIISEQFFGGDAFIVALSAVIAEVIITGGLHLDGLGDTADALLSYRNRERMLEIMKDSRLGTNAMLAVLFVVLFKIAVIAKLVEYNLGETVIIMPAVSRFLVLMLAYRTESPREFGMGNAFIGKCSIKMIISGILYICAFSCTVLYISGGVYGLYNFIFIALAIMISAVSVYLLRRESYKKIGGITGDILGCGVEISEIVFAAVFFILCYM